MASINVYTVLSRKSAHGRCTKKQGGGRSFKCFRIQPRKSAHLCLRTQVAQYSNSSDRAASARESKPSQHIYIAGVTSNITAHHVVFAAAKRWLRSSVEAAGPSSAQASQATHMDTIDTDTQTNRLAARRFLPQIRWNISLMRSIACYTRHEAIARGWALIRVNFDPIQ